MHFHCRETGFIPSLGTKIPQAFSSVQSLSHIRQQHARPSITNSWSLLKLLSIELLMPSSNLILCHPLLLLPSIFPSIRVFSNESVLCIRWPQYWNFSFSISPSNEYSGLISFRMDWLDLLAVQGTLYLVQNWHFNPVILFWRNYYTGLKNKKSVPWTSAFLKR